MFTSRRQPVGPVIQRPTNGTSVVITGWNITHRVKSHDQKLLQQAEIFYIDGEESQFATCHRQDQFCVGRYQNDTDICYGGVFGDPVFRWINSQWIQIGLSSYCEGSNGVSVSTNLTDFSDWIQSTLNFSVAQTSLTYQCDREAICGCGQTDVNITISGVINSDDAVEESWPMIVSIQFHNFHRCAGSILSESFILTSATCAGLFSTSNDIEIVAGIYTISGTTGIRRNVSKIYSHPNYDTRTYLPHDIAILRLDQPIPLDMVPWKHARTCMPMENHLLPEPNSRLVIIGWNTDSSENVTSDTLQQMSVISFGREFQSCRQYINDTYQFCVKPATYSRLTRIASLCRTGIGGPVLMYTNNHWEQVGIVSDPYSCHKVDQKKIYTRLAPYIEWIKTVTNSSFVSYNSSQTIGLENITTSTLRTSTFTTATKTNDATNHDHQKYLRLAIVSTFLITILYK